MAAADSLSKGKQAIFIVSSSEDSSEEGEDEDEEESDSWLGQSDEEDDDVSDSSEEEEEDPDIRGEGYEDEEFEPDQEEDVESSEGSDEDGECESISEDLRNEEDDDKHGDRREGKPNEEELCDRVIDLLLRRNKNLDVLKLEECKAYLRKHELMISGAKATCIQRILEHWRLKDGNGERLYPKSSFNINCRGDVCKGDVVMFKQRVYEKFSKVLRSGKNIGKRTIAGRVVKESYGDAKQQHTFTIEVLWSKGVKQLRPLYPLLVKGRNLYRYTTFRQHWRNEAERSKVLEEKHRRGAIARHVRASTRAGIGAGSKRRRGPSVSRQHHSKRPKKDSEAAFTKKQQKNSSAKAEANTRPNKKPTASAAKRSKKLETKKPSAADYKKFGIKTQRQETFGPRADLHRRNSMAAAPVVGWERFQKHSISVAAVRPAVERRHLIGQTFSGRVYQLDERSDLGRPYLSSMSQHASSRSSGHFFTPAIHDSRFRDFHFHGPRQH